MLKRKLEALGYPNSGDITLDDRMEFACVVLWLEDQKIRLYTIEDREILRNVKNMQQWEEAYKKYCKDLSMPSFETDVEQLTWMLGHAIRLEFLDDPSQFESINAQDLGQSQKVETIFNGQVNVHDNQFIAGVRTLSEKLKVPYHPNHLFQLEAVARIVRERLSPDASNRRPIVGNPFPFDKGNDVVSANDAALDYPMRILRLLQIQSLRQLQTHINETIVGVQNLTANPKTDTKLGKVGR